MSLNKTFGSMLIIAGTTIGAGMLALPLASAGLGFTTATIIMIGIWALMTYTALLMLEVHQHADPSSTLNSLAHQLLGRKGQTIATLAMFFLFYALCAAYIAGGGSQLSEKISTWTGTTIAPQIGAVIFTIAIASVVSIGTHSVDMVNRILFTAKVVALAVMLGLLLPHVQGQHLVEMPIEKGLILSALPVIFTSFGFHGSIPSIVRYIGIDIKALKKIMIFGSALPLVVYILWQLASQGIMGQPQLMANSTLGSFISSLSQLLHNPMIGQSVSIFADLALATSFLGVSLGLFDFLADTLNRGNHFAGRGQTALITFLPPLAFAVFYPQGFIMALGYAAISLVILAIFLPVAMVRAQRKAQHATNHQSGYVVKGGSLSLGIVTIVGIIIITAQLLQMVGIIPAVG
ncbi:tyrosine transporter TyrP [Photobacterium kishitanii]|uniref:tyrosine transporter TyrP n=1 Tax=Photobacterium kishitanii TaxID=318456 RepID=UPI0005D3B33F|nr:tyrosine transporter TyrP [Photobacterium kishitanii]KJG11334.1 tyrosine transporter TyrP [Photobacterium kishitanii]PSU24306.1 tyrosine transporter TyrP [Photobacterium kishitanii]PSV02482.1 tyrosine transporter TyrP [Photobacterium kishitanii]PSV75641.1 tyrosine transporter TyrP [Photobacterium kishitanii]PSW63439.1 tyrosine transporter TyrP [Photobacterium kishitanii]